MNSQTIHAGTLSGLSRSLTSLFQIQTGYLAALQAMSQVETQTWILNNRTSVSAWTSSTHPNRGYIGLCRSLASDQERADEFYEALGVARLWLYRQHVKEIYAPVDGSTWFQYRLSPATERAKNFLWEPEVDEGLEEALLRNRFLSVAGYHSTGFETDRLEIALSLLESSYQKTLELGFSVVPISHISLNDAAPILFEIASRVFQKAFLYEPLSYESFRSLYVSRLQALTDNLSHFLLSPEQDILGFIYSFADQDLAVVKTVAISERVSRDYHFGRSAPSLALLYCVLREAKKRGLKGGVSALVHDEASSTTMERFQRWSEAWRHEYHLFKATKD